MVCNLAYSPTKTIYWNTNDKTLSSAPLKKVSSLRMKNFFTLRRAESRRVTVQQDGTVLPAVGRQRYNWYGTGNITRPIEVLMVLLSICSEILNFQTIVNRIERIIALKICRLNSENPLWPKVLLITYWLYVTYIHVQNTVLVAA